MIIQLHALVRSFVFLGFLFSIIYSCKTTPQKPHPLTDTPGDSLQVATKWCTSCHLFPDPSLLTKNIWRQKVLPNMGCRLGIQTFGYTPFESNDMMEQTLIHDAKVYAEKPLMTTTDWSKITEYIINHAPDSFRISPDTTLHLNDFEVIPKGDLIHIPRVTMLHFDTIADRFHIGIEHGEIYNFDRNWKYLDSIHLHSTPIDYAADSQGDYILSIGRMYPSELKAGVLYQYRNQSLVKMLDKLHRPVSLLTVDLNGDHTQDFLISQFGFETGSLTWFEGKDTSIIPVPRILKSTPGAIKSISKDMDGDGIKDIIVLMAQGDEHVSIFKMNDRGIEKEYQVLRFPPVHGVCDIDLKDFNNDGKLDIIIANGDNADYSQILKPYHGITVYLNQGELKFKETLFIPYPGVLHCIALDFDQDGDMDIAATSFFPGDNKQAYAPFKYFEQQNGKFIGRTFSGSSHGKWMTMIDGDFDRDGDQDIFLGSFLLNNFLVHGTAEELKKYSLVLLKNKKTNVRGIHSR